MLLTNINNKKDLYVKKFWEYFECELPGYDPLNPCDRSFMAFKPLIVYYGFSGMLPAINLIFIISIQDMKRKCVVLCSKVKSSLASNINQPVSRTVESREMA